MPGFVERISNGVSHTTIVTQRTRIDRLSMQEHRATRLWMQEHRATYIQKAQKLEEKGQLQKGLRAIAQTT